MTIWLATGNIHKKKELAKILSDAALSKTDAVDLKIPADAGLAFDPEETGNSFLENALIKAKDLYRLLEEHLPGVCHPVIADDSGICVDALAGRPGIYSARYTGPAADKSSGAIGAASDELSDTQRNALLLAELGSNPRRSARFVCAMVLYRGADRFFAAQETMEGELVLNAESARGAGGFGYDPILYIPELGRTVAELSDEEKNRFSHRGKAGRVIGQILTGSDRELISGKGCQ
jgi:XTP/dITP diphosphohydrolase